MTGYSSSLATKVGYCVRQYERSGIPSLIKTALQNSSDLIIDFQTEGIFLEHNRAPTSEGMALPVSVGDAILLSRIAFSIGRAFTSGRKSAPAEFSEIQDLLFGLSEALKLLAKDLPDGVDEKDQGNTEEQQERLDNEIGLLAQMILNCGSTLVHLKTLVDKYMVLDEKSGKQQEKRKWKDEIIKNWRTILWTKEGGDIAKLKVTLTTHINCLNLAVSTITKYFSPVLVHSHPRNQLMYLL